MPNALHLIVLLPHSVFLDHQSLLIWSSLTVRRLWIVLPSERHSFPSFHLHHHNHPTSSFFTYIFVYCKSDDTPHHRTNKQLDSLTLLFVTLWSFHSRLKYLLFKNSSYPPSLKLPDLNLLWATLSTSPLIWCSACELAGDLHLAFEWCYWSFQITINTYLITS